MTLDNSHQSSQYNENQFSHYNNSHFDGNKKRKRIRHYLVDRPINHPFPLAEETESAVSIGQGEGC
jgi:hypothetical protein